MVRQMESRCRPLETKKPLEVEQDSCLSSSSRKQGVSTVLTRRLQMALSSCVLGP